MKSISLKLQNAVFQEMEKLSEVLKTNRNQYINEAIAFFNKYQERKLLEEQSKEESKLVATNSMAVLQEFELLEDLPQS